MGDIKVKKFRIKPRLPMVGKILKTVMDVKRLPENADATIREEMEACLEVLQPAAFYQTWSMEQTPFSLKEMVAKEGIKKAISVSALVGTIGSEAEDYLSELLLKGDTLRAQVVTAIFEESADLSLNFLLKLLNDDAKGDDCEVSDPLLVSDEKLLPETLSLLEAEKEGVTIDAQHHLAPRFTRVALAAWIPVTKKKKQAALSKKRSA